MPEPLLHLEVPATENAPRMARDAVAALDGALGDEREDTLLLVSELVTNAVIHTGTSAELTVQLDAECVTVLVRDGGGTGTVRPRNLDDPLSVSGRGLGLVDAVATAWAAEHGADGTTVWFELLRPDDRSPH